MRFILYTFLFGYLFFVLPRGEAQDTTFRIFAVNVECSQVSCEPRDYEIAENLKGTYDSQPSFTQSLQSLFTNESVQKFESQFRPVIQGESEGYIVDVVLTKRQRIDRIDFLSNAPMDLAALRRYFPLKEGDYIDPVSIIDDERWILQFFRERAMMGTYQKEQTQATRDHGLALSYHFEFTDAHLIQSISVEAEFKSVRQLLNHRFQGIVGQVYDRIILRDMIEQVRNELVDLGNYNIEIQPVVEAGNSGKQIRIVVTQKESVYFTFQGNKKISTQDLRAILKELFKKERGNVGSEQVIEAVRLKYEEHGYFENEIKLHVQYVRQLQELRKKYHFVIREGYKRPLAHITFAGNYHVADQDLQELLLQESSDLVKGGYYDSDYLKNAIEKIKNVYYDKGYAFVRVIGPIVKADPVTKSVVIDYKIQEGPEIRIRHISFDGLTEELVSILSARLKNRKSRPLLIHYIRSDVEAIEEVLDEQGYLFSSVVNRDSEKLLQIDQSSNLADIQFEVALKPQMRLRDLIIVGNRKTKRAIILREVSLRRGDLISQKQIRQTREKLMGLAIFENIEIEAMPSEVPNQADLLIKIKEKPAGTVELSPGYRSDIGLKLASAIGYQNLGGKNRSVLLKGQLNKRLSSGEIDSARAPTTIEKIEYDVTTSYYDPYFLSRSVGLTVTAQSFERIYYSFDAKVMRSSVEIGNHAHPNILSAVSYELEKIEQYRGSASDDNGKFLVANITPSLLFDYRDNKIMPLKGLFLEYSCEVAHPYGYLHPLGSKEVSYAKLLMKQQFFYPAPFGGWAAAVTLGIQQDWNSRDDQGIPEIKLMRMSSLDGVRGYTSSELNRLESGLDLYDADINHRLYLYSIKLEPRIMIDKVSFWAPFLDFGKLSVDGVNSRRLKSSVGLSYKYITPVGALNLNYGFKLWRRRMSDGLLESPGELTVSIGNF